MSIILSLAGNGVSSDSPPGERYGKVIRISGKGVIRIFGTRNGYGVKRYVSCKTGHGT
jgi:DnaJ-class molecular chaperone